MQAYTHAHIHKHARARAHTHTISCICVAGDIVQLARQFECLLHESHAQLYYHLLTLGVAPLKLVFNWIVFVFVGYLEVDQIMAVWDRILGEVLGCVLVLTVTDRYTFILTAAWGRILDKNARRVSSAVPWY